MLKVVSLFNSFYTIAIFPKKYKDLLFKKKLNTVIENRYLLSFSI
jgi:hypothetical protein